MSSASVDLVLKENFLIALSDKGETAVEVAAFASTFRDMAVDPKLSKWHRMQLMFVVQEAMALVHLIFLLLCHL